MDATLVDSNVILDIVTGDPDWLDWSAAALARQADAGSLVVNPIVYAEVAARFERIEDLEAALPEAYYKRQALPWEAAFLAGRSFVRYRRSGGQRRSPLPDFYIGAHALIGGMTLLTRDARRYRTYFPALRIIAPRQPVRDFHHGLLAKRRLKPPRETAVHTASLGALLAGPAERGATTSSMATLGSGVRPRRGSRQIPERCVKLASIVTTAALEDV